MRLNAAIAVFVLSACPIVALAGDLNPPAGPVRPSMKALDAIEPRVCLNDLPADEGAAVLITEPGSYFLRADVRGFPGAHGIRIVTSGDVQIDLNGFSVLGVPGSLDGINMVMPQGGAPTSLSVRGCGDGCEATIAGWAGDGIRTENVITCNCTHLIIANNGGNGITHLHAENVIHRDVATRNNLGDGVRASDPTSGLRTGRRQHGAIQCVSTGNGGSGHNITNTTADFELVIEGGSSNDNGIYGATVQIAASQARGDGSGTRIRVNRWECARNESNGMNIALPPDDQTAVSMSEARFHGNGGDGYVLVGELAQGRHHGHVTVLKLCEFTSNGGNGASSDNPLHAESCTFGENVLHGSVYNGPIATELMYRDTDCVYFRNGGHGVHGHRGRFTSARSEFSDNGGSGVTCDDGCVIMLGCDVTRNTECGVFVVGSLNATDCTFRRNDEAGCKTRGSAVMDNVVCEYNGVGASFVDCTTVTLRRCVFNDNASAGVMNRSVIGPVRWMSPECIASRNGTFGFDLTDCAGGAIVACIADGNGSTGFQLGSKVDRCTVERCSAADNGGGGFNFVGAGNLIVGNRATGGAVGGYNIGAGNVRGPIIGAQELITNTNPDANIEY